MTALHRHETASVGLRSARLTGAGSEHARLLRLVLLAYTRWPGRKRQDPWPCNATLALRTGLDVREVKRAMACLRRAEVLTTRWGKRPGCKPGRIIALDLHAPCKALAPEGHDVRNIWAICRSIRARPAALVTMMAGAYMLASDAAGAALDGWSPLGCTANALHRFIGQADNASWTSRVRDLEALGLIRREGRAIEVSPPRAWLALVADICERESEREVVPLERRVRPASPQPQVGLTQRREDADLIGVRRQEVPVEVDDVRPGVLDLPTSAWVEVFEHEAANPARVGVFQAQGIDRHAAIACHVQAQAPDLDWLFAPDGRADEPDGMIPEQTSSTDHGETEEQRQEEEDRQEAADAAVGVHHGPELPAPEGLLRCDRVQRERMVGEDDHGETGRGRRTGTDGAQAEASRGADHRWGRVATLHVLRTP